MSVEAKLAVWLGAALVALSVLAAALGFSEIRFSAIALEDIGALFLTLILVALVIERAVEVYVSTRFDAEKLRVRRPLTRAEATLARAETALAEERERAQGSTRVPTDADRQYMEELVEDVGQGREAVDSADEQTWNRLSKLRGSKVRSASLLSVVLGVLAAVAGIRVLGQFIPMQVCEPICALAECRLQLNVFRVTDTVMTALVLAGGGTASTEWCLGSSHSGPRSEMSRPSTPLPAIFAAE